MFRKGKSDVESDLKKSRSGIETEAGVEWDEFGLEASLVVIHREEKSLTFARIERKTPILRPAIQLNQSFLWNFHCTWDRGAGGPNGQVISIKKPADERRQRSRKIIVEKREKSTGPRTDHCELERSDYRDFEKPHKRAYQKGTMESNQQGKKGGPAKSVCGKGRDAILWMGIMKDTF